MGVNFHPCIPVTLDVQVGVVLLPFGERGDRVHELHGSSEIGQLEVATNSVAVMGQSPVGNSCEVCLRLRQR